MSSQQRIVLARGMAQRLKHGMMSGKYLLLGKFGRFLPGAPAPATLDKLQTFCCFVGHGRSGGTLVGALLNAHPNVVMSNELNALRRLAEGLSETELYRLIYVVSRRQVLRGSRGGGGYTYEVPGQWQGRHARLQVIGDRKAGATAYEIHNDPQLLELLDRKVSLEKRFIQVVRNPFDVIATTFRKTNRAKGEHCDAHLMREIHNYFARCSAIRALERRFGEDAVCHVSHERLIEQPGDQLALICGFLGIDCPAGYVRDCASILRKEPHESRRSIGWLPDQLAEIEEGMREYRWLARYAASP